METYLSIEGVAKYLGVSEKAVRKWVLNREIPYCKVMKLVRFRVSEIEEWISSNGKRCLINESETRETYEEGLFAEMSEAETPEAETPETGTAEEGIGGGAS